MKALVTGANGFTGSHLVRALLDRGIAVVAYVRESSDLSRLDGLAIDYQYGDITNTEKLTEAMQGVDWLFHLAAYVELGIVDAAKMQRANVQGTQAVLAAMQAANVSKMIYCSTIGIFGDTQGETIDETFVRTQKEFSSAYDETKYAAQQLVNQAVANGAHIVSVMPSGIFGADDPHFIPVLKSFKKGVLKVWAGGDRVTGIVHVDDLVEGMLLAIEQAQSGEYFILSASDLTSREMFDVFSQETGVPVPIEAPKPVVKVVANILDVIGRTIGWQPPIDRERAHYVYDRCVRVTGAKAMRELGWKPRSAEQTLREIARSV
ncbi:NAD-dependent epimerase/dehydratase family protein [filamentous cyanobacterium LEGE 11480]|uniref:NAD-dependent epimerase/dehydratase family protein n=2 Tax=Romeriopsis TaxID=2992131 RepID=A0A928Z4G8_9CYAN|nr:NAD-dependent epimerase/dehydratase family protein [Romeriopsis navalis LEGE 11480]